MADKDLRDLERRAAAGDAFAAKRLATVLVRTGVFQKAVETVLLVVSHLRGQPIVDELFQKVVGIPHTVYEVWIDHDPQQVSRFSSRDSALRYACITIGNALNVVWDELGRTEPDWSVVVRRLIDNGKLEDALGFYEQRRNSAMLPAVEIYEEAIS